jgi:hypothetical protein
MQPLDKRKKQKRITRIVYGLINTGFIAVWSCFAWYLFWRSNPHPMRLVTIAIIWGFVIGLLHKLARNRVRGVLFRNIKSLNEAIKKSSMGKVISGLKLVCWISIATVWLFFERTTFLGLVSSYFAYSAAQATFGPGTYQLYSNKKKIDLEQSSP